MSVAQTLVVGLPRSGTTWVAKLFDSSRSVFYLHEPDSHRRIPCVPLAPSIDSLRHWQPFIDRYVETLFDSASVASCTKRPWFPKDGISKLSWNAKRIAYMLSERMGVKAPTFSTPDAVSKGKLQLVWKSVESLGRAGILAQSSTPINVYHVVRHPCGFVASVLRGEKQRKFQKVVPLSEDMGIFEIVVNTEIAQKLGLTLDVIAACTPTQRLAWYWTILNAKAARELRRLHNAAAVSYDAICSDPLLATKAIYKKMGLTWEHQTEQFVLSSSSAPGKSYYGVMRNSALAAKGWQEELSDQQVQDVIEIASSVQEGSEYLQSSGKLWLWTSPLPHLHRRPPLKIHQSSTITGQTFSPDSTGPKSAVS